MRSWISCFRGSLKRRRRVLARTPEMLPVLKEAGVVDSGGQGLVQVLKGAYDGFLGKEIDYSLEETELPRKQKQKTGKQPRRRFGSAIVRNSLFCWKSASWGRRAGV